MPKEEFNESNLYEDKFIKWISGNLCPLSTITEQEGCRKKIGNLPIIFPEIPEGKTKDRLKMRPIYTGRMVLEQLRKKFDLKCSKED